MSRIHLATKYINWIFIFISILVFIYTYYRSEIVFQGWVSSRYFKYYLLSLSSIVFWILVLKLKNQIRSNIVFVAISLLFGLYLIEGILSVFEKRPLNLERMEIASNRGVFFDKRTKLEVVNDFISNGVDAVPTVHPSSLLKYRDGLYDDVANNFLFPLGGISNKTTVYYNESGKYLVYQSDRYGFNNPDEEWDSLEVEWALLGDSFVHGAAVQTGEDISGQIRSLTSSSVINLGSGGNGPLAELATLKEYAKPLRPKKVLWVYYEGNDLVTDLPREKIPLLLKYYFEKNFIQGLISKQEDIDKRLMNHVIKAKKEAKDKVEEESLLYNTKWLRLEAIRKMLNFDIEKVVIDPMFSAILNKAKLEVNKWGGKLYFVYLPAYARYSNSENNNTYRKKSEVIGVVKKLGIPVVDIHQEVFFKTDNFTSLFPFGINGHYNKKGYNKVAKAIISNIE